MKTAFHFAPVRCVTFAAVALLGTSTVTPHASAALIHDYSLNGTFADSLGGPSLVGFGGTLGPFDYSFDTNQGLSLSNALSDPAHYSIMVDFSLAAVDGYRRILEFKDRTADFGIYNLSGAITFYPGGGFGGSELSENVRARFVVTRDSATDMVTAYIDGVEQFAHLDTLQEGVFDGPNNVIHLFLDNISGEFPDEAGPGLVDRISIFDDVLTAQDVAALGVAPIPEPGTALFGVALVGVTLSMRRRICSSAV